MRKKTTLKAFQGEFFKFFHLSNRRIKLKLFILEMKKFENFKIFFLKFPSISEINGCRIKLLQ